MGKDIHIENAEGVHIEGNRTVSGKPVDIEIESSSGVIRDQPARLILKGESDFDIIDSDLESLVVDQSVIQLYEVLVKGIHLRGEVDRDLRTPQYFTNGFQIDTRRETGADNAMEIAVKAGHILDYLSRVQLVYWLVEQGWS